MKVKWLTMSLVLVLCSVAYSAQTLINVDFGTGTSPLQVGPAVLGSAGDVWTRLTNNNLLVENLQDSDGIPTAVTYTLTGSVSTWNQGATVADSVILNLMRDYLFNTVGKSVNLSGLKPGTAYTLVCFAGEYNQKRNLGFTVDGVSKSYLEDGGNPPTGYPYPLVEGKHYVVFEGQVGQDGELVIVINGYVFNGFQLLLSRRGEAHTPVPANFDQVDPQSVTSLSWYSPLQDGDGLFLGDPNIASVDGYDVWFGTAEPNELTDIPYYVAAPTQSLSVELDYSTTYYWRVDTTVAWDANDITGNFSDVIEGQVWRFTTMPAYLPPTLTFNNVITTLDLLPAVLSASITGNSDAVESATFTLLTDDVEFPAGANASVANTTTNNQTPTATLETGMAGTYKVKLTIWDGTTTVEKIAAVYVYADACAAIKALPGAWTANYFDRNGNCIVNLADFAVFAAEWLDDTAMTEQETYAGDSGYPGGL